MAQMKLPKFRFKVKSFPMRNCFLFSASIVLLVIIAHVRSATPHNNNLPVFVSTIPTPPLPEELLETSIVTPSSPIEHVDDNDQIDHQLHEEVSSTDNRHHHHHSRANDNRRTHHNHHHDQQSHRNHHHQHHNQHQHHHQNKHHHPERAGNTINSNDDSQGTNAAADWHKRSYQSKFTIDQLLNTKFDYKVSNDIDMDPCKAGGFMGDIALPDVDYGQFPHSVDPEMQADEGISDAGHKYVFNYQLELEKLKQEVYHEGLQVEEEGLTHIIRKKTKLPSNTVENTNDPMMVANELVKPTNQHMQSTDYSTKSLKNQVLRKDILEPLIILHPKPMKVAVDEQKPVIKSNGPNTAGSMKATEKYNNGPFTFIDHQTKFETNNALIDNSQTKIDLEKSKANKSISGTFSRNVDQRKIQSNTKDIEDDSGNNFIAERKIVILPTSLPNQRSTLPNVYSNAGGNGMKLDDVEILHSEGVIRKQTRRGRKHRSNPDRYADYIARLERLREELNRPSQHHKMHEHRRHRLNSRKPNLNLMDTAYSNGTATKMTTSLKESPKSLNYTIEKVDGQEVLTKRLSTMDAMAEEVHKLTLADELDNADNFKHLEHHHRMTRAVTAKKERIWDYGVIPYEIDGNFTGFHKALFKQAMRHWENSTCIKFVERDPQLHPNYIVFTVRSCGCCSFVGKRGNGPQAISIGRNCDKFGIVVHELGHVVGFWHEHTRPDREKHVIIEHLNIMKGQDYNFNKLTPEEVDSLGMEYDYDSIMHYARNTFSKGTYLDTILPIQVEGKKRPEIGQRIRLSVGDIAQANLLYKCPQCGRTIQESTGSIENPSFFEAGAMPNVTEHCEWRITATHGEKVVLRLDKLDLFKSENCESDYLEIRDGYYYKSPLLGRLCGKVSDKTFTSESSRMLLTYANTRRPEGFQGFHAEFDVVCGGEIFVDNSEGHIESPNYPLDYLPNKECVWKISVAKGYQVALKFQSFEVENHDSCVYDFVEVHDGDTADSTLIGVFCGHKPPPNMKSTGNTMYVKFVSDMSVQRAGFSAVFMKEVDECETQNHGCEHDCINTLGGYECSCRIGYELHSDKKHCEDACGGIIEYPNGTITSPSFPEQYPINKECIWEIIAPPKHKISLNFTHFELEGTAHLPSDCGYDSVTIFSKLSENRLKRIGTYCGNAIPPTATSESNALRVEFHSDKSNQHSGFAAVFFTDIDECSFNNGGCQHECRNTIGSYLCSCRNGYSLHENGHDCKEGECKREITAPFGTIYSPNYPDEYPPNAYCIWYFSTTPGHRIKLLFNEFKVESHQECNYDRVAVYDGNSEISSLLGVFCGEKIPYPITSTTNEMYMVLIADKYKQLTGFTAIHSTFCGGYLRATTQIQQFYSHALFGNRDYNDNMDCEWTIQSAPNTYVQLMFLTFDLETSENCTFDYVQVFSGMEDTSGPMYGQFCGSALPQDILSMTDTLLVRFKTDHSYVKKGFSASYVMVEEFENSEADVNHYSSEMVTPFPGSLKSIYREYDTRESEDYSEYGENRLINSNPNRYRNQHTL